MWIFLLGTLILINLGHSDGGKIKSESSFNWQLKILNYYIYIYISQPYVFLFMRTPFSSVFQFLIGLFWSFLFCFLCILESSNFQIGFFFTYSIDRLFTRLMVFFAIKKLLTFMWSFWSVSLLNACAAEVLFRKSFSILMCSSVFPTFLVTVRVSDLKLKSLMQLELSFIQVCSKDLISFFYL